MAAAPPGPALPTLAGLDFPRQLLEGACHCYAPAVQWSAPRRGLVSTGRDEVLRRLLTEAGAMGSARVTPLRRTAGDRQIIDEYAVRFIYSGSGIDNIPFAAGDSVELERLRILGLEDGRIVSETCIETWSRLHQD